MWCWSPDYRVCGLMHVLFHPLTWSVPSRAGWGDGGGGGQLPWHEDSQAACGKFHRVRNQGIQPAAMLSAPSWKQLQSDLACLQPHSTSWLSPHRGSQARPPAKQLPNSWPEKLWDNLFIVLSRCILGWWYTAVDNCDNWGYSHCNTDSGPK